MAALLTLSAAGADTPTGFSYDVHPVEVDGQQNTVTAITQTRNGYLWMGSYNGLGRYDGVRLKLFDALHTPELQNSRVTSIFEDTAGELWIGHETGALTHYKDDSFQPYPLPKNWPGGA